MKRLIERARQQAIALEHVLDRRMTELVRSPARPMQPLEIRNAILREIEAQVIPGPRGTKLIPYNQATIDVLARTAPQDAALLATLEGDGGLEAAARACLARRECESSSEFCVRIALVESKTPDWPGELPYRVNFGRAAPRPRREPEIAATLVLTLAGALEAPGNVYRFSHGRLDVGRVREVRDRDGRLVRRNTLVISDAHDPNGTVSRRHAHVKAVTGPEGHRFFAVYDDGSRYGTRIVRNGESLTVHPGTLGVRLRDGDELHFGEVMAFVRLDSEAASGAPA